MINNYRREGPFMPVISISSPAHKIGETGHTTSGINQCFNSSLSLGRWGINFDCRWDRVARATSINIDPNNLSIRNAGNCGGLNYWTATICRRSCNLNGGRSDVSLTTLVNCDAFDLTVLSKVDRVPETVAGAVTKPYNLKIRIVANLTNLSPSTLAFLSIR